MTLTVINIIFTKAQPALELDYITELQTNFGKKYNWVNLLSLSAELPSEKISSNWANGSFHIHLISINKIFKERIADDLMTFSNIEEDNLLINPFVLGYTHRWQKISLFGGLRNVNNDYFITPYTSLFTNSSAGIFPTLSINYPLANYPLSAVCLHFEYKPTEVWLLKSSLYNGVAHDPRKNVFNSFTVNPHNDGIFSISEINFAQNKCGIGRYALGITLTTNEKSIYSAWVELEQSLYKAIDKEIGGIVHIGVAQNYGNNDLRPYCRYYNAIGGYASGLSGRNDKLGIYLNMANFADSKEHTLEITWQYPLFKRVSIQPTLHYIATDNNTAIIGLCRLIINVLHNE